MQVQIHIQLDANVLVFSIWVLFSREVDPGAWICSAETVTEEFNFIELPVLNVIDLVFELVDEDLAI